MNNILDHLAAKQRRYDELTEEMSRPEVASDVELVQRYAREQAELETMVSRYNELQAILRDLESTRAMLSESGGDHDMAELAREEIVRLETRREELVESIRIDLLPRDPNDEKDVIVEIRAGTGGDEAALFAADLYRMYTRYAERQRWTTELIDVSETGIGGIKEVTFEIHGQGAYSRLKFESGVHRVQRVPATEASGRIHTSTATVAVLPEVEEVEVNIDPSELRIDIYRSGGAGGQNVNKVETAIRITHLPTGIVVTCQDERSQLKNRLKAMAHLRARLYDIEQRKQNEEVTEARRSQVGTGERSEKIRTYNFPEDRITDHRVGLKVHMVSRVLAGELDAIIEGLAAAERDRMQDVALAR
jgi:peptide chain release factor 1